MFRRIANSSNNSSNNNNSSSVISNNNVNHTMIEDGSHQGRKNIELTNHHHHLQQQQQQSPAMVVPFHTPRSISSSSSFWNTSTPTIVLIGFLLYLIVFQYGIILSKDETIQIILLEQQQSNNNNNNSLLMKLYPKQYQLLESFKKNTISDKKCDPQQQQSSSLTTTTTQKYYNEVGVFPYKKPSKATTSITGVQPQPWIPYTPDILTKVSYPIFVPSLPKSGTTSIWKYFKCGNQYACHNWVQIRPDAKSTILGKCIESNIRQSLPPFHQCGAYDVYTDTGYLTYDHDIGEQCFYPSIDGLDAIYESYPNVTFVNVVRDTEAWYESIKTWSSASLFVRLRLCNATGFPNGQSTKEDFMKMYNNFNIMIRQFVKDRPSITYIEVQLESKDTGRILEEAIGIDRNCWKLCKPQERHCQENQDTTTSTTGTTTTTTTSGNTMTHTKHQKRHWIQQQRKKQKPQPPKSAIKEEVIEVEVEGGEEGEEEAKTSNTNDDNDDENTEQSDDTTNE